MRIPHFIDKGCKEEYETSEQALALGTEQNKNVYINDFQWDIHLVPTLEFYALKVITKNFFKDPIINKLPCADREEILEMLPLDLDLFLVVPLIQVIIFPLISYKFGYFGFANSLDLYFKN